VNVSCGTLDGTCESHKGELVDISDAYVESVIAVREAEFADLHGPRGRLGRAFRCLLAGAAYVGSTHYALSYAVELMAPRR
jgi:hypothetical protein